MNQGSAFIASAALVMAIVASTVALSPDDPSSQEAYLGEPLLTHRDGVLRLVLLPPKPGHPRNSEGDLIQLKDGRIILLRSNIQRQN